jgi:hypothetical protein
MSPEVHDFGEKLAMSHAHQDAAWWKEIYWQAFGRDVIMANVRNNGWAQQAGIDRVLTLKSGKVVTVDEKVREKHWPDILLERWSDERRRIPGWVQKNLACDFLAYAFIPSGVCYLFPFLTLRRCWRLNGRNWCEAYKPVRAQNNGYVTVSVAVPTTVLLNAMRDTMIVSWSNARNAAMACDTLQAGR